MRCTARSRTPRTSSCAVSAAEHPESRRILALAQRAFGELRGLLAGLPDALVDKAPRAGEWPIREVLGHMFSVERRYALANPVRGRSRRCRPMRLADNQMPPTAPASIPGDVAAVLGPPRRGARRNAPAAE
jgi:hypothetical protein